MVYVLAVNVDFPSHQLQIRLVLVHHLERNNGTRATNAGTGNGTKVPLTNADLNDKMLGRPLSGGCVDAAASMSNAPTLSVDIRSYRNR